MNKFVRILISSFVVIFYSSFLCPDYSHSGVIKNIVQKISSKFKSTSKNLGKGVGKTYGGSSTVLASRLGIAAKKGWAAHHIIPTQLKNHRALKKIGMDMDNPKNGIALPTKPGLDKRLPLHRGSHPNYSAAVAKELDKIPKDASIKETEKMVKAIQKKFKRELEKGKPLHEKYGATDLWY